MKFTDITDPIDALLTAVVIVQALCGLGFIAWIWRRSRRAKKERQTLVRRHARIHAHPRGFITPELLQALAGIALIIALGLIMAAGFADDPRW